MNAKPVGLILGALALIGGIFLPTPEAMPREAMVVAGLVVLMAAWWISEAIPLTATALMPFLVLPFAGVMNARETASAYYSPILFLLLGGAFIALAIERTGLHRRLSLAILKTVGAGGGQTRLLLAFMISAALLSMLISNTSTALIMMPMALAVLSGGARASGSEAVGNENTTRSLHPSIRTVSENIPGGRVEGAGGQGAPGKEGLAGALPMGIAFAASIGGLGTIVGSPTNAIAVGLLSRAEVVEISFVEWTAYGLPLVIVGVPLAAAIVSRVQKVAEHPFDVPAARAAIDDEAPWSSAERRLVPVIAITFLLWMTLPLLAPLVPEGSLTDGTIAIAAGLALFLLPDGTGRPLLVWSEADRAPWGVIMMFGGGLALAAGMQASGLAAWLGNALLPLEVLPLVVIALAVVAMVVLITEFASNVATATAIIPVVASLIVALGADPVLLAMPAALAASWGFMLPAGTGPNAIAWSTRHIRIERMVGAGILLDLVGIFLIVALVWGVAAIV